MKEVIIITVLRFIPPPLQRSISDKKNTYTVILHGCETWSLFLGKKVN